MRQYLAAGTDCERALKDHRFAESGHPPRRADVQFGSWVRPNPICRRDRAWQKSFERALRRTLAASPVRNRLLARNGVDNVAGRAIRPLLKLKCWRSPQAIRACFEAKVRIQPFMGRPRNDRRDHNETCSAFSKSIVAMRLLIDAVGLV